MLRSAGSSRRFSETHVGAAPRMVGMFELLFWRLGVRGGLGMRSVGSGWVVPRGRACMEKEALTGHAVP